MISDYVVVGGGTAGAVVAARLSEDPDTTVSLLEWGPTDLGEDRALQIRRWTEMLGSEYDLDYACVPQERGNSRIRQSRAKILGGCSSHNLMLAWRPLEGDLAGWVAGGAEGWGLSDLDPYYDRLETPITPVADEHRGQCLADAVTSASRALSIGVRENWSRSPVLEGAGFMDVGYDPETGIRSSSSVSYLHPILDDRENLHLHTETRALRVEMDEDGRAACVHARTEIGDTVRFEARREVVLACGAIDTPRLLLLSGIGPAAELRAAGIEPLVDLPGVGRNLMDHVEGLVLWEANRPTGRTWATAWDAGFVARVYPDSPSPDVLAHFSVLPATDYIEPLGYRAPDESISITPSVARPRSRGRVWVESPDPDEPPRIDPRYFTDPDGHDEEVLVAGIRMARKVGATEPLTGWIEREVFPGPDVESDAEISELVRQAHGTVFHVSCTCRMGAANDHHAVVDPRLRVRGIRNLRIVDASVFPALTALTPVGTVLALAERAAEIIRTERGAPMRSAA